MALAERLNPDKEALVFSSGNNIYVFAYGERRRIADRPGKVQSLAVAGRLLDSGNYRGARDTLSGKTVAGRLYSWERIAESEGQLFGSINTNAPELHGVWQINEMHQVQKRTGRTKVLSGNPLIDSGDYIFTDHFGQENFDFRVFSTKQDWTILWDRDLADIADEDLAYQPLQKLLFYRPTGFISMKDKNFFVSSSHLVFEIDDGPEDFRWLKYVVNYSRNPIINSESALRGLILKSIHKDIFKLKHSPLHSSEEFNEMYEIDRRIESLCEKHGIEKDSEDFDKVHSTRYFIRNFLIEKVKINSMVIFQEDILVAGNSGRIELADKEAKWNREHVLFDHGKPITAMVSVPIEVYEEGIKQEVLRRQRARVCHAKKLQENIVPLRKAA